MEYGVAQKLAVSIVLGILLAMPIWGYATDMGAKAKEKAILAQAQRSGLNAWWHKNDADELVAEYKTVGTILIGAGFCLCYFLAPVPLAIMNSIGEARREASARAREERQQAEVQASVREMESNSERQAQRMNLAQSKQSIVMQLGTFDQFIRVWRDDSDVDRKALAIQGAHSEITQMKAKLVAGELDSNSLNDPQVIDCARATVSDLQESGLAGDRLCGDLRRIFRL